MLDLFVGSLNNLIGFLFYYPLFMAYLWMIGALIYYFRWENIGEGPADTPLLTEHPPVSIIVPCHNEAPNVVETISWLDRMKYPDFEIIAVNDGSTDGTGRLLDQLAKSHSRLRVIHFDTNQGKAMGLRMGALAARSEFLVCIDGDALLEHHALPWLLQHFLTSPRVAAVTGNPRIRTRSTLLGKIQVGEFSAILGLIKRAQRIYGRIFTMSGVVSAFRKSALHQVGYWNTDMVTEDIDISWKLQLAHWDIRFEPNALCWILMPETLKGLWKQRLRWSQGGCEVLLRYMSHLTRWKSRRMWPVYFEYLTSLFWGYSMLAVGIIWLVGLVVDLPLDLRGFSIAYGWPGMVLAMTCLLQFAVGLALDSRYERGLGRLYYVMIWYPLVFWLINLFTTIVSLPKALRSRRGQRAVWGTPDRGVR
ncbi:MAG TPA: poly-beta-1,6-N-acetyl-D-glucosamine synthase [Desulfuromonadales bacterium]|nr:poly-beta-1,6-N-acetyl-D-glucosamine synthase [Desulfuromonadales bacterium]